MVSPSVTSLGEIPGILWTPGTVTAPTDSARSSGRARRYVSAAARPRPFIRCSRIRLGHHQLPGSGSRPGLPGVDAARRDLRHAVTAGKPVGDDIVDRLITPLIEQSVPE